MPIVGTFVLAARVSQVGLDCRARATWGRSLVRATTIACTYVPSPMDGVVIWQGSGGGESASVGTHAMNYVIAPVDRISDQDAALLRLIEIRRG